MGRSVGKARVDYFVSYAGPDRPWAEWAAQQLERHKFSVELDAWDWSTGDNFVLRMNDALARADRVLALYSPAYFARERFTADEWAAVLAERADADGRRRLVPVRVAKVEPPPVLRALLFRDLFDLPEAQARQALLEAVSGPARPAGDVPFPGSAAIGTAAGGARVPGSLPGVWNVRRRNPLFTGRGPELAGLRERLCSGERALVQALHGIGGVGKTELAVEYAHLFGNEYELVWWIDAERPELIGEQLAALALAAGWVTTDTGTAATADLAVRRLQQVSGWLLVYDNAETVEAIAGYVPDGTGHVVITSRSRGHGGIASPVEVGVLDRVTSVARLRAELPALPERDADQLAAAVQGLPLALGQAAGFLAETGMPVGEYLHALQVNPVGVLAEGPKGRYPESLPAVVATSMRVLDERDPAAGQLMRLVAVLAPEAVPLRWLSEASEGVLPDPLAAVAANRIAWRRSLGRLANLGLARVDTDSLQVHRLTQALIAPTTSRAETEHADRLLAAAAPADTGDPRSWPGWADLVPHLLVRVPATTRAELRQTGNVAVFYLLRRGEYRTAQPLASAWHERWRQDLGDDHPDTLNAANSLASALYMLGDYKQAHRLQEDILTRRRRIVGDDHPDTLAFAGNLASSLREMGDYEQARRLLEDNLTRRRHIFGDDHPDTLTSTGNLASALREMGHHEQARRLLEDNLTRRRRILGDDHPDTLTSAHNLAGTLHMLGDYEQARRLLEDTLTRRRRILGDDHPDTLTSANNLARGQQQIHGPRSRDS